LAGNPARRVGFGRWAHFVGIRPLPGVRISLVLALSAWRKAVPDHDPFNARYERHPPRSPDDIRDDPEAYQSWDWLLFVLGISGALRAVLVAALVIF